MKFLADMNVSMNTVFYLRRQGYDAVHLREQGLSRLADPLVLDKARKEGRIILTFDLDFGDLMAMGCHELPSIVIFRLRDETPASVAAKLDDVIRAKQGDLNEGTIIIVEDFRYRTRRLPLREREND